MQREIEAGRWNYQCAVTTFPVLRQNTIYWIICHYTLFPGIGVPGAMSLGTEG